MNAETIKEFLIGIGFKLDDNSERKFQASMRSAVIQANLVSAAVEGALKSFAALFKSTVEQFDQLYYASNRIGASVSNIRSYTNAVTQLGATAGEAGSSLESFGKYLRAQPGATTFIESLGVSLRKANGELKDTEELLEGVAAATKARPYALQLKIADMFGVDEKTWRALTSGEFQARKEKSLSIYGVLGLNNQKTAEDSRNFVNVLKDIENSIGAIVTKVSSAAVGDANSGLRGLLKYLNDHANEIANGLTRIVDWVIKMIKAFAEWVQGDGKTFDEKMASIGASIHNASVALEIFLGLWVGSKFLAALGSIRTMAGLLAPLFTGIGALSSFLGYLPTGLAGAGDKEALGDPRVKAQTGASDARKKANIEKYGWLRGSWENLKESFGGGAKGASLSDAAKRGHFNSSPAGPAGTYRPAYNLGAADLSDSVVNTIAGEAYTKNQSSVDAVINNMLNRTGSHGWGPSGNLQEVARAPGQYAGYRRASQQEADFIRARIRAIASGGVADNTNGSNSYRAGWYNGPWGRKHADSPVIGGNRFAYDPAIANGPYAPYKTPRAASLSMPSFPALSSPAAASEAHNPYGSLNADSLRRSFSVQNPPGASAGLAGQSSVSPTVNQHNNVTIQANDPAQAAAELQKAHDRSVRGLADVTRNMAGAAQ